MLKQFILKKFLIFLKKFVFCIASAQCLRDIFWCTCSAAALRACIRLGPHVRCRTVSMRCPGALAQLQQRLPTTLPAYTLPRSLYALVHLLSCSTAACLRLGSHVRYRAASMRCPLVHSLHARYSTLKHLPSCSIAFWQFGPLAASLHPLCIVMSRCQNHLLYFIPTNFILSHCV